MIKKIPSLLLISAMALSSITPVFATNVYENPDDNTEMGTQVVYTANATREYSITVPALLNPGQKGNVVLSGQWSSNDLIRVTADETVSLKNNISGADEKILDINFYGIEEVGNNTGAMSYTEEISVAEMPANALFGKWTGHFNYNVSLIDYLTVLEGDGQTFYRIAPSNLTFRSNAPLNEFQAVKINGQVLDESQYTLTEGSTVVSLDMEYLKTLSESDYTIEIVSLNKKGQGTFDVDDGDWNDEVGFWYNKPYVLAGYGMGLGVMFNEDNTLYGVVFDLSSNVYDINKYSYTIKDGKVECDIDGVIYVAQGTEDENILSVYTTDAPDDLMEFWHYEKACVSEGEYFYAEPWAAWTGTVTDYDAQVLDRDKEYYHPILTGVNGVVVETNGTYRDCINMKKIEIPYGITFLGDDCFENCSSLSKIQLPKSVTRIYDTAFTGCVSLQEIKYNGTIEDWNAITKDNGWNKDIMSAKIICIDGIV